MVRNTTERHYRASSSSYGRDLDLPRERVIVGQSRVLVALIRLSSVIGLLVLAILLVGGCFRLPPVSEATPTSIPLVRPNSVPPTFVSATATAQLMREGTDTSRPTLTSTASEPAVDPALGRDLAAYRDALLDDETYAEFDSCLREIGGNEGLVALMESHEGVRFELIDGERIIRLSRWLPEDSERMIGLHDAYLRRSLRFEATLFRVADSLRSEGYEIPSGPNWETMKDEVNSLLWLEPFSDEVWLAIRDDAWTALNAEDDYYAHAVAFYRYLQPGCGQLD